jgi:hypothetical protein
MNVTTRSILLLILNILSTIVGITVGLRCILRLVGASQSAPLITWINNTSDVFLYPFRGIFQDIFLGDSSRIDITAIFGLIIYAILFSVIYKIIYSLTITIEDGSMHEVHSHI